MLCLAVYIYYIMNSAGRCGRSVCHIIVQNLQMEIVAQFLQFQAYLLIFNQGPF